MIYDILVRQSRSGTANAVEQVMGFRLDVKMAGSMKRISLAGDLLAEGVGELKQVAGGNGESLELDLSDLRFADSDGVEALRRLIDSGATAIGASPFVKNLLAI